ncbi:SEC-C domain-containing protein [Pseudalkalibacillus caeni]|uniref:SEC-C domain-containing protein n=1 Tax=Exobacillus caeni TaxID=2574798 RepID=A0A5R9EYD8_9BACL|nr:SEC-C domain-containing protein [Pseudalkalibacillus caeni]TLS35070.1 SEC-C domain-containing protein [Pseudalkalibacillus caeni]
MLNIKRNELCPCGSGKKYKKCCLKNENKKAVLENHLLVKELSVIQAQMIEYAMERHQELIVQLTNSVFNQYKIKPDDEQVYMEALIPWAIFTVPVNQWQKTIAKEFIQAWAATSPDQEVLDAVNNWKNALPSVYEVQNHIGDETVSLKDIWSNEQYNVVLNGKEALPASRDLVLGILLDAGSQSIFYVDCMKLQVSDKNKLVSEISEFANHKEEKTVREAIRTDFPSILFRILAFDVNMVNPIEKPLSKPAQDPYRKVADLFISEIKEDYSSEAVEKGLRVWEAYTNKKKPAIRKESIFAAALEYMVAKHIEGNTVSQSELAKKYATSASSISSRYKEMKQLMEDAELQSNEYATA